MPAPLHSRDLNLSYDKETFLFSFYLFKKIVFFYRDHQNLLIRQKMSDLFISLWGHLVPMKLWIHGTHMPTPTIWAWPTSARCVLVKGNQPRKIEIEIEREKKKSAWKSKAEVLILYIPQMEVSLLMLRGTRRFQTSHEQETGAQTQTLDMVVTAWCQMHSWLQYSTGSAVRLEKSVQTTLSRWTAVQPVL